MNAVAVRPSEGEILERFEDFAIRVTLQSHVASFEVKEIGGEDDAGRWYYKDDNGNAADIGFDEGETFLSGDIKWDGCSNWDFHTSECMAHFCGRQHATSIGRLMAKLYDIAAERMPSYDKELGG